MQKTLALAAATALAVTLAGPASAGPNDAEWKPSPDYPAFTMEACGTEVTIDEHVNEYMERETQQSNGTRIEARGRLEYKLTTPDGRSAVVDASGAGKVTINENYTIVSMRGSNLLMAPDPVSARLHRAHGLPLIAVTQGPVNVRITPGDEEGEYSMRFVRAPIQAVDACTLLKPE